MNDVLSRIVDWAQGQAAIRALILAGSTVASPNPDELADLDIAIFASDPAVYTSTDAWLHEFGSIWNCQALSNEDEGGYPTRLVIYEGGRKVDFTLAPLDALHQLVTREPLPDLYNRGYRVLLDKDNLTSNMPKPTLRAQPAEKPTATGFFNLVNDFWHEAYHVPKYLVRDDLWLVKQRDWNTKLILLDMLAWYMKSKNGWAYDTFYLGKHIKDWLDPELYSALFACFARFDGDDGWAAFFATARLFRQVSEETAHILGYPYPREEADHIVGLAEELYAKLARS